MRLHMLILVICLSSVGCAGGLYAGPAPYGYDNYNGYVGNSYYPPPPAYGPVYRPAGSWFPPPCPPNYGRGSYYAPAPNYGGGYGQSYGGHHSYAPGPVYRGGYGQSNGGQRNYAPAPTYRPNYGQPQGGNRTPPPPMRHGRRM